MPAAAGWGPGTEDAGTLCERILDGPGTSAGDIPIAGDATLVVLEKAGRM